MQYPYLNLHQGLQNLKNLEVLKKSFPHRGETEGVSALFNNVFIALNLFLNGQTKTAAVDSSLHFCSNPGYGKPF